MMKKENIHRLLEKYFEGETNLLEEKQLRHYFLYEDIAPELLQYKVLFTVFEEAKNEVFPLDEKDIVLENKTRNFSVSSSVKWAVAAVLIITLSISWFANQSSVQSQTLSEQEIQIAQKYLSIGLYSMEKGYEEGNKFMSKTALIDKNTREVERMGTIYQKNIEKLNHVNHIDQSFEKLQNISSMKKSKLKLVM